MSKKLTPKSIFDSYKSLSTKDRIKFDMMYLYLIEQEEKEIEKQRLEFTDRLNSVVDIEDNRLFSTDWVNKKILGIKDDE